MLQTLLSCAELLVAEQIQSRLEGVHIHLISILCVVLGNVFGVGVSIAIGVAHQTRHVITLITVTITHDLGWGALSNS